MTQPTLQTFSLPSEGLSLPRDRHKLLSPRQGTFLYPVAPALPRWFDHTMSASLWDIGRQMGVPTVDLCLIDTGVMSEHPLIRRCFGMAVDVTGEGPQDDDGHGTLVALSWIARAAVPMRISSCKALGRHRGGEDELVAAIGLAAAGPFNTVNISIGLPRRRPCSASCRVCTAVRELAASGKLVFGAGGQRPGDIVCPATAVVDIGIVRVPEANQAAHVSAAPFLRGVANESSYDTRIVYDIATALFPHLMRAADFFSHGYYSSGLAAYDEIAREGDRPEAAQALLHTGWHYMWFEAAEALPFFVRAFEIGDSEVQESAGKAFSGILKIATSLNDEPLRQSVANTVEALHLPPKP